MVGCSIVVILCRAAGLGEIFNVFVGSSGSILISAIDCDLIVIDFASSGCMEVCGVFEVGVEPFMKK
jgi:hypothetical protein